VFTVPIGELMLKIKEERSRETSKIEEINNELAKIIVDVEEHSSNTLKNYGNNIQSSMYSDEIGETEMSRKGSEVDKKVILKKFKGG